MRRTDPSRRLENRSRGVAAALLVLLAAAALALGAACGVDDGNSAADGPTDGTGSVAQGAPGEGAAPPPGGAQSAPAAPEESGAARGATGDAGSGPSVSQVDLLGRKIIRNGSLDMEVESVTEAFERIRQIAEGTGGFVSDSTFSGSGDEQSARLTLRVPSERFGEVMSQIRALGAEVHSVSTSSQDVTEEFDDLEAQLRNLRAVESQYVELLNRAQNISDILQVQERLNQVRMEIERVQGRLQLLESLTDMGTIQVTLRPEDGVLLAAEPSNGIGDAARAAWEASLATLEVIARGVVVVAVYSWWLVPFVVAALLVLRRMLIHRERPASAE